MEEVEQASSEGEEIQAPPSPPKLERQPPEKPKMTGKVQFEQCGKWLFKALLDLLV